MSSYRHTQRGSAILWMLGFGALVTCAVTVVVGLKDPVYALVPGAVLLLLLVVAYLFGSLTVEVSSEQVAVRFGPGLVGRVFEVGEITDAKIVRNRWFYGWGIRGTPYGVLYNAAGLDAVEIQFRDGEAVRVGTDEPSELQAAILAVAKPTTE